MEPREARMQLIPDREVSGKLVPLVFSGSDPGGEKPDTYVQTQGVKTGILGC